MRAGNTTWTRTRARTCALQVLALIVAMAALSTPAARAQITDPGPRPPQDAPRSAERASPLVNLNTATADQLEALPGIGPATASRIVEYRQKNGPFKKLEDLMNIKGIGEKSFLKLKPLVTVAPARNERGSV